MISDQDCKGTNTKDTRGVDRRTILLGSLAGVAALQVAAASTAVAQGSKAPNILVIFGDDIGYWNTSAYNRGMMGYRTPNIDRIAK
jgi:arylsulfatase